MNKTKEALKDLEIIRLREALNKTAICLEKANNDLLIKDTIWIDDAETLFDFIGDTLSTPTSIDDLIKEFETDPEMAVAISQSRAELSDHLYAGKPLTLPAVRLSAGLSQSQLGEPVAEIDKKIPSCEIQYTHVVSDFGLPHGTKLYAKKG